MENMSEFGEIFANGRIINLDKASIADLERYLKDIQKNKDLVKIKLDNLVDEIKNI